MRLPVKDRKTTPWIDETEIPAVKAALSAWRKLRKSKKYRDAVDTYVGVCVEREGLRPTAEKWVHRVALGLMMSSAVEKQLWVEAANAKR